MFEFTTRFILFIISFVFSFNIYAQSTAKKDNLKALPLQTQPVIFDLSLLSEETQKAIRPLLPKNDTLHLNEEDLNTLTKKLFSTKIFTKLKIVQNDNGQYTVIGQEADMIYQVIQRNKSTFSNDDFTEITGINAPERIDYEKFKQATDRLKTALNKKGYQQADVTFTVENKIVYFTFDLKKLNKIYDIRFEGLDKKTADTIRNTVYWAYVNKPLTDDLLKSLRVQLRRSYNDEGLYLEDLSAPAISPKEIDSSDYILTYKTSQTARYKIILTKNKTFSTSYLKNDILKLSDFSSYDATFIDELKDKLIQFYNQNGFLQTSIVLTKNKKNDSSTLIHFDINEGPQTLIHDLSIQGQIADLNEIDLKAKFNLVSSGYIKDGIYNKDDFEQSIKNFITQLQNEGYVSARVRKTEVNTVSSKNDILAVQLKIFIDSGLPTKLRRVSIENNVYFNQDKLMSLLQLKIGHTLNLDQLEKSLANLYQTYQNAGYLEFQIKNLNDKDLVQYSSDASEADIHLIFHEGPQIIVKRIILDGNTMTRDQALKIELEFKDGDILTPTKINESIARLQKTGLFVSTDIKMLEENSSVAERTIIVKVSERNPGLFTASVGMTNELQYTFKGALGIAYRNISGWGRGLSLRGEASYNPPILNFLESKVTVGYLEPYLFLTRSRFRVNYTTAQSVSDYTVRKKTITNQAIWSVEQDITSHLTGIWQIYNIANYVDSGITAEDEIKYGYSRQDMVIASTGPIFDLDYRDNILNPFKGHFSSLNLEYASQNLGSNNIDDFIRITGQTTLYTPLSKSVSWANSLRGGYLHPLKMNSYGVRFDKKGFILGGRTTIRGFESNEFFPSTNVVGPLFSITDDSSYQLLKSELRFPLSVKNNLQGALFYDGGQVFINNLDSAIQFQTEWRDSMGFGIRYNLPIGPLSLEYARKLNKKSSESDGAFHLSVGIF